MDVTSDSRKNADTNSTKRTSFKQKKNSYALEIIVEHEDRSTEMYDTDCKYGYGPSKTRSSPTSIFSVTARKRTDEDYNRVNRNRNLQCKRVDQLEKGLLLKGRQANRKQREALQLRRFFARACVAVINKQRKRYTRLSGTIKDESNSKTARWNNSNIYSNLSKSRQPEGTDTVIHVNLRPRQ